MAVQVFISHTKGVSTDFGRFLYTWLCDSPLDINPWASFDPEDLGQGHGDQDMIRDNAKRSDLCISILDPSNIGSHWINFEAGLFYGKVGSNNRRQVFTMLIDGLEYFDLTKKGTHPLSNIYHCYPNKEDSLENLLITMYKNHSSEHPIDHVPTKKMNAIKRFIKSDPTKKLIKAVP